MSNNSKGTGGGREVRIPWAYSALRPRLWRLDAKAVFPLMLWLLHWSWWTLGLALGGVAGLALMDLAGLTPESSLHRLRSLLVGEIRPLVEKEIYRRRAHW